MAAPSIRPQRWLLALTLLAALTAAATTASGDRGEREAPNVCVPGTFSTGWCGDGDRAVDARLAAPGSIVALPDGGFAFGDMLNSAVREVTPAGTIRTLASLGGADGCPPAQLALAPDGMLLVAAPACGSVLAISPRGAVSTLAGGDAATHEPGAPQLVAPTGVAALADGVTAIADDKRIVLRGPDGSLRRVRLHPQIEATTLLALPSGRVLAAGETAGVVWRVDVLSGRTRVVLGHPRVRRTRGGPLVTRYDPVLGAPAALAATPDGGFAFADLRHHRVRRVDRAGNVRTVAGDGTAGFAGDGGLAQAARLSHPAGVAFRADGAVLIADAGNDRIRLVAAGDGTISTIAGSGEPPPPDNVVLPLESGDAPTASSDYCLSGGYCRYWNYFYATDRLLTARHGRTVTLGLITSRAADVVASISRGGRAVRRVRAHVSAGRAALRVGAFSASRYVVELDGRSGGHRQRAAAALLVR
jgi:hypothetical protein